MDTRLLYRYPPIFVVLSLLRQSPSVFSPLNSYGSYLDAFGIVLALLLSYVLCTQRLDTPEDAGR